MRRIVTNTRGVATIEREGGDRTMDDDGRGFGPRPEGGAAPLGAQATMGEVARR